MILTITDVNGSSKTLTYDIASNRLFKGEGVEVHFEQSDYLDFDKSVKLVFSNTTEVQRAFSFRYYGMLGDFNSAPTNIDRWRQNIIQEPDAPLNKYVYVPGDLAQKVASSQTSLLSDYADNLPLLDRQNLHVVSQNKTHLVIAYDQTSTIDQSITVIFDSDVVSVKQ